MTADQIQAVKCALADLEGSLQAFEAGDQNLHCWRAHQLAIDGLKESFPFLEVSDGR